MTEEKEDSQDLWWAFFYHPAIYHICFKSSENTTLFIKCHVLCTFKNQAFVIFGIPWVSWMNDLLVWFFSLLWSLQCCSTLSIEMSLKIKILVTIAILVLTLNVFFLRLGVGHVGWRSVLTSIMSLQRSGRSRCVVDHNVVTSHIKVPCQQNNNEKWPISWDYLKCFKIHYRLPLFPFWMPYL